MKKILLVFAILMTTFFSASAQFDGFITNDDEYSNRGEISTVSPCLPGYGVGATNEDQPAPLGSGLLILTALGGAYLFHKKD